MLIAGQPEKQPADEPRPVVSWEESSCPLCHGPHWSPLLEAQDPHAGADGLWYAVVQCDSCGTCFTNPRPDPATVARFYPPPELHHQPRRNSAWPWRRLLPRGGAMTPGVAWHGEGRLLDVGCGSGAYLRAMRRRGWKVTGLDASPRMAERVRDELGLPAHAGTLPHLNLEPESFDVITMWHTLEHVHEPLPLLREARKLLAPQGKLVLAVPNIDSWPFRWFGRHWFGLELPRHLTHFTPATLPQMLQRAGFVCEPLRYVRRTDWLRASARLACRQPNPPRWQRLLTYRLPAIVATWGCFFAEQSDGLLAVAHR
ncbi:MAG: class I SAM-dependent methyltransferase [Gemmataceae bacterium]